MAPIWARVSITVWILFVLSAACAPAAPPRPTPPLWQGAVPIGEILAHPDSYVGREVVIVAYYRGWDLFGEVGHGPPLTRSDVAVADATGAIYVVPAGEGAFPPGLLPFDVTSTETLLRCRGTVERAPTGALYLRAVEGTVVEGLPVGVLLRVRRQGGLAGFDHELMATDAGFLYLLDRRIRRYARFPVDPAEVLRVLDNLRTLPAGEHGAPVPDGFAYHLTVWEGDKAKALTLHDPSAERLPEAAARALETLRRWVDEGMGRMAGPIRVAVEALAGRLGIPPEEVTVASYDPEPRNWPDASMGCPEPGQVYAQVITSGYRVFLKARGRSYEVHVDQEGNRAVVCP